MYCSQCGSKLIKTYKFCTKCGAKIRTVVEEKVTKNDSSASTKFFNDYFDHKNNERTGFFKRKEHKRTRDENPKSNFEVFVFCQRNVYNQYWFDGVHR